MLLLLSGILCLMKLDMFSQPLHLKLPWRLIYSNPTSVGQTCTSSTFFCELRHLTSLPESTLLDGSKGIINFPWNFFLCNVEFSPCWALPEYSRALIHSACLRVFSVTPWVIVYRLYRVRWQGQSDWFSKITLDPLRMMEYRVSKASTVSIITAFTRHQLSIDIFFSLLSLKYDIKIQNAPI